MLIISISPSADGLRNRIVFSVVLPISTQHGEAFIAENLNWRNSFYRRTPIRRVTARRKAQGEGHVLFDEENDDGPRPSAAPGDLTRSAARRRARPYPPARRRSRRGSRSRSRRAGSHPD